MARTAGGSKASVWRQRFHDYSKSGLTVTTFCRKAGVSVPTFYHWRRKLKVERRPGRSRRDETTSPAFRSVTVLPITPAVAVCLPQGARIEVGTMDLGVIRTVVAELVRAHQATAEGESAC
jgi:transposase-like protein